MSGPFAGNGRPFMLRSMQSLTRSVMVSIFPSRALKAG